MKPLVTGQHTLPTAASQDVDVCSPALPPSQVGETDQRPQVPTQDVNKHQDDHHEEEQPPPLQRHLHHGARDPGPRGWCARPALRSAGRNMRRPRRTPADSGSGSVFLSGQPGVWEVRGGGQPTDNRIRSPLSASTVGGRQKGRVGSRARGKLYLSALTSNPFLMKPPNTKSRVTASVISVPLPCKETGTWKNPTGARREAAWLMLVEEAGSLGPRPPAWSFVL